MLPRRALRLATAALVATAGLLVLPTVASAAGNGPVALRAIHEVQRGQAVPITLTGYSPAGRSMTFDIANGSRVGSISDPSAPSCDGDYCTATATYTAPAGTTAYEDLILFFVTDSAGNESFVGNYAIVHATPPSGPVAHSTMTEADRPAPDQDAFVHPEVDGPQGSLITLTASSPLGQDLTFAIETPFERGITGSLGAPQCSEGTCTATFPYYRPMHGGDDALFFTVADQLGRTDRARMAVPFAAPAAPTLSVPKPVLAHVDQPVEVPVELDFDGWNPTSGKLSMTRTYVLCLRYDSTGGCMREKRLPAETLDTTNVTGDPLTLDVPDPGAAPQTDVDYLEYATTYQARWVSKPLSVNLARTVQLELVPDETTLEIEPSRSSIHRGDAFTIGAVVTSPAERPVTGGVVAKLKGHWLGVVRVRKADDGSVTLKVPAKATKALPVGTAPVKVTFSSDEPFATSVASFDLRVRR